MTVQDPVCGMRFEKEQSAAVSEHEAKIYYFCAEECRNAFERDQ